MQQFTPTLSIDAPMDFKYTTRQTVSIDVDASATSMGGLAMKTVRVLQTGPDGTPTAILHATRTDRLGRATLEFDLPAHLTRVVVAIDHIGLNNMRIVDFADNTLAHSVVF